MKALVYEGPASKSRKDVPDPVIQDDGDAIVRVDATTICGTDLHILKGDVPEALLRLVASHQVDAERFVSHHFEFDQVLDAYDVFGRASETGALKVVITR